MNYDSKRLERYQLVTINVPAGSTVRQWYFPDQPDLRDAIIQHISAYHADLVSLSPQNLTVISSADLCNAYMVLNIGEKEDIKIPLNNFIVLGEPISSPVYNVNGYIPLADLHIHWSKSYIQFAAPYAATQFQIMFGVFYKN